MSKKLKKNLYQQQQDAVNSLPIHDSRAVEDVQMYLSLPEETINNLPQFNDDGEIAFYQVGDSLLGKLALVQFIKQIKNR